MFDEPLCRPLDKIPLSQDPTDDLLDLVGAVVYVSEVSTIKCEEVEDKVRDIFIADQSMPRPLKISAWNKFAEHDVAFFHSWPEAFTVVGFCGIQPITYRGISLKTSMSTKFVEDPTGTVEDSVRSWVEEKRQLLEDWRSKAIMLNDESSKKTPIPLAKMGQKKANMIWQDDKFWIQVSMSSLEEKEIYCYTGCNKCGKSVSDQLGTKFVCSRCHASDAVAVTRALMNVVVYDKTGSLKITAFTSEVELIVGLKVDEISALRKSENGEAIAKKVVDLRKKEMLLQVAPTNALFINNVLKWTVRAVEVPPEKE